MRAHLRLFTVALSLSLLAGAPSLALGQPLPVGMARSARGKNGNFKPMLNLLINRTLCFLV